MYDPLQPDGTVLIVDDDQDRIDLLVDVVRHAGISRVTGIVDPGAVVEAFYSTNPDLVILGGRTKRTDGIEMLAQIRTLTLEDDYLPILVLGSDASRLSRERALAAGATDFLSKPFTVTELTLRVRNLLHTRRLHLALAEKNRNLDRRVRERTAALESLQIELLQRLALASEYHDDETGEHTRRVGALCQALAQELGVAEQEAARIGVASQLHDIGKIGIPDAILQKPGKLTQQEFDVIKKHTRIGATILSGSHSKLLQIAETIALTHHERWDGQGYAGMIGTEIPLVGRIVAVADVFDALTHRRCYKPAWPIDEAIEEIRSGAGTQFDPDVVAAFARVCRRRPDLIRGGATTVAR